MDAAAVQRFSRQIALAEIGPDGQERLARARVVVIGDDATADMAALYLTAAGVGAVDRPPRPRDGAGWLALLAGAAAVVRSGFDDDAMVGAAARLGVPAIAVRARPDRVDLVSLRNAAPAPDAPLDVPPARSAPATAGGEAVVAGTLAAAEAIWAVLGVGTRSAPLRVDLQ